MKNERLIQSGIVLVVVAAHMGLLFALWKASKVEEPIAVESLTFVDLSELNGDGQPAAPNAPKAAAKAPPPPPPKTPAPKPRPKPIKKTQPTPEPKMKAVVKDHVPADVRVVEKPKPKPKPEPIKPQPKPEPKPDPIPPKPEPTPPKPEPKLKVKADIVPKSTDHHSEQNKNNQEQQHSKNSRSNNESGKSNLGQTSHKGATEGNGQAERGKSASGQGNGNHGHANAQGSGAKGHGKTSSGRSNSIVDGGYTRKPHVNYPRQALQDELEGTVHVKIIVEANGSVSSASLARSSGHASLDRECLRAAKTGGYRPVMRDGQAHRTSFTVPCAFSLDN